MQNQYNHITRTFVPISKIYFKIYTYLNYCSRQNRPLLNSLIFWFFIKGNQLYYTWITYTPVSLVGIQLLFSHCVKYAEIRDFSNPYFPVCGQNRIRIFSYLDRIGDSVQIRENTDTILPTYGKIRIREIPYFGIFHAVSCWTFSVIT